MYIAQAMPYKDTETRKAKAREYARKRYVRHRDKCIAATLASRAKDPTAYERAQRKFKEVHPEYFEHKNAEYYALHGEERKAAKRERYAENPKPSKEYTRRYYKENRVSLLAKQKVSVKRREYAKRFYRKLKERVIAGYGGSCVCCGEATFEFLTIDHIEGGGRADRAKRTGAGFYSRLEKEGFPKAAYRLLCMNCNFAFGIYGHCPHHPRTTARSLPS